ncbi:Glutathione S-transferase GST-6.0 (plasmid) [Sulfitobacter sp. THAF37]|uniref:glutathione S-transferase family protein n=1 Tax=Sulfitobacter sp. THAF37 TaxID=2587855 RepID=UPI001268DDD7|nr:glutathione S-transferase family protein [Sulfitobacter sp. THAF37]QFT61141.1 Glutathione S-transferase GST-6.0 [Sulfitobacter sp. THAF37]
MLTFFHAPGSCSNGILFLLNEVGAEFECERIDLRLGDQRQLRYRALNPKGKVPALRLPEGEVLTEFQAIALWLASAYPQAGVLPRGQLGQARMMEALDFIVGSVHMRGFTFLKMPGKFHTDADAQKAIQAYGRSEVERCLILLSDMLGDKDYLLGDFSAADAALFFVLHWAEEETLTLPPNLAACLQRLRARPSYTATKPGLVRNSVRPTC